MSHLYVICYEYQVRGESAKGQIDRFRDRKWDQYTLNDIVYELSEMKGTNQKRLITRRSFLVGVSDGDTCDYIKYCMHYGRLYRNKVD